MVLGTSKVAWTSESGPASKYGEVAVHRVQSRYEPPLRARLASIVSRMVKPEPVFVELTRGTGAGVIVLGVEQVEARRKADESALQSGIDWPTTTTT